MRRFFIALLTTLSCSISNAFDPYDAIDALLPHDNLPRLLNAIDLPESDQSEVHRLLSPTGDFNLDGHEDMAISGIYDLPKSDKYFLLITTLINGRFKKLYFKDMVKPVFLYNPGTTGAGDPGTQAFSLSFCSHCSEGQDIRWDKENVIFRFISWPATRKAMPQPAPTGIPEIPMDIIDKALRVVGLLPDIQKYVNELTARQGILKTWVERGDQSKEPNFYWVRIFEIKESSKIEYDRILVDINKMAVVKRRKTNGPR